MNVTQIINHYHKNRDLDYLICKLNQLSDDDKEYVLKKIIQEDKRLTEDEKIKPYLQLYFKTN